MAMQRIMSKAALAAGLASFPLAMVAPSAADAQAVHGAFGARSEASIRISVSVAPRFQGNPSASQSQDGPLDASAQMSPFHSNAPGLRYSVSISPVTNSQDSKAPQSDRVLFLIIPD